MKLQVLPCQTSFMSYLTMDGIDLKVARPTEIDRMGMGKVFQGVTSAFNC